MPRIHGKLPDERNTYARSIATDAFDSDPPGLHSPVRRQETRRCRQGTGRGNPELQVVPERRRRSTPTSATGNAVVRFGTRSQFAAASKSVCKNPGGFTKKPRERPRSRAGFFVCPGLARLFVYCFPTPLFLLWRNDGVLYRLGYTELDDLLGRDLDRFTGRRIAAHAGFPVHANQS